MIELRKFELSEQEVRDALVDFLVKLCPELGGRVCVTRLNGRKTHSQRQSKCQPMNSREASPFAGTGGWDGI